jgi:hypothetical protein
MDKILSQIEFYNILDETNFFFCCGESQFIHICKAHDEVMGCYYCEFDYSKPCECEE